MVPATNFTGGCSFRPERTIEKSVALFSETKPWRNCFTHRSSTEFSSLPQISQRLSETQPSAFFVSGCYRGFDARKIQVHGVFGLTMPSRKRANAKVYQFPLPLEDSHVLQDPPEITHEDGAHRTSPSHAEVVISRTFRKDPRGLRGAYDHLNDLGFEILSPTSVSVESEADGFVFMEGESRYSPEDIELRHLNAIQQSVFVWLHAPDGYVGTSGSLEVGFAHAIGVPVYSQSEPADPVLRSLVTVVPSPDSLIDLATTGPVSIPRPPLQAFQKYYQRAAIRRGYAQEDAKDTLVLMMEEFGELARAIRKRTGLKRHGADAVSDEGMELADVFIYVVHMANVLDVDLSKLVQQKELWNLRKFRNRLSNEFRRTGLQTESGSALLRSARNEY
jgi:NTP pyrophosphatase (non-canonical NTP hydrolase)